MLESYFPIIVFIALAGGLGIAFLLAGLLWLPQRPDAQKLAPYECGFEEFGDARMPFDVRFYMIAILFIIFDLETAFFFPWAVVLRHVSGMVVVTMAIFLALLVLGFIYEWKRGALTWEW